MNDEVINWLKEHDRPFATASEMADAMGVRNAAIHKRMKNLISKGIVEKKVVGASAAVYWLCDRESSAEYASKKRRPSSESQ